MLLRLMRKKIDTESLPVLFMPEITDEALARDWTIHDSDWNVQDGWFVGMNRDNSPGMMVSRADFRGNVLLEFDAKTIPPCTHDINCMWSGSWDPETNMRGIAYVSGLQGWWTGKVGIEKSPEYKLNVGTPLFQVEPGRTYHVITGSADGHIFMAVDGVLLLEATDPDPIDTSVYGKIGFEAYCSQIAVRNVVLKQLSWSAETLSYEPEF